ncbi:serine hydrolase [Mastigocoleus testarum]|nr:serine hydrolase [Mastigocoleus testarum]
MKPNRNRPWYVYLSSVVLGFTLPIVGLVNNSSVLVASQVSRETASNSSVINVDKLENNDKNLIALTEKSSTKPTKFWWLHGASVSQIKSKINQGYRIIDWEVEKTSPLRFSVAMVRNKGEYAKKWWWYYGLSSQQVKEKLNTNKARIIDLEIYRLNGQKKYAVALVSNTGADAKSWWYYSDSSIKNIIEKTKVNKARIVDLDTYVVGGKRLYSAVMIKNTGSDRKAWWYYYNVLPSFINSKLKENKARLVDIERHGDNKFMVVMEKSQGQTWWWYYGKTATQVNQLWQQNQARIFDIEPYTVNGKKRFAVLMLNNANLLTTRIGEMLRNNTDGVSGLYLKKVNGSVLASLKADISFYPASTIKVLEHLHAMKQVEAGKVNLNSTKVKVYLDRADSCSDNHAGQKFEQENLRETLKKMMKNSNNQSTNAIQELFGNGKANVGRNTINQTAYNSLGMSKKTALNHKFACGGPSNDPANSLTLKDLGKLYEKVSTGVFTSNSNRDTFYELMLNRRGRILTVIDEEASKLGLSTNTVKSFKSKVKTAGKGGSFTTGNGKKYTSIGGWVKLPFQNGNSVTTRDYVFGLFIDKADTINDGFGIWSARAELLRDEIRKALVTFK